MVRTTELLRNARHPLARAARFVGPLALVCLTAAVLAALSGCSGGTAAPSAGSSETTKGAHMAGPVADVNISQAVINATPEAWNLKTPQSTVRSYLDWTSYAYSIAQSWVATPTMTPEEDVRVDGYIQLNIQKSLLISQKLDSLTFGKQKKLASSTLVPVKEKWTYSYLSTASGNKVLEGPFTASYDATYTVIQKMDGTWVVDSVDAKPEGTVK
jgi:hypothetical protein